MRDEQQNENESWRLVLTVAVFNAIALVFTHEQGTGAIILGGFVSTALAVTGWYFVESWGDK